jgi:hypothetical protein
MYRARVLHEVRPRPWVPGEKFTGQHRALELIAPRARRDQVASRVIPALGERKNMIERGIL